MCTELLVEGYSKIEVISSYHHFLVLGARGSLFQIVVYCLPILLFLVCSQIAIQEL